MANTARDLDIARLCASCQRTVFEDRFYPAEEGLCEILSPEEAASYGRRPCLPTGDTLVDQLPELSKLDASARQGCDFCHFLRAIILSGDTNDLLIQVAGKSFAARVEINIAYSWRWKQRGGSAVGLMKVLLTIEDIESQIELQCFVEGVRGSERVAQWLGVSTPSEQSYLEDECLSWIQDRIQTCCNSHSHDVLDGGFIPARLLDVTQRQPKLVHRAEINSASHLKYAALSYCWGSAADSQRQTKTTADTLPQRVSGLQDAEMTAVLRDAVRATRALSIPYLWVDALCILQGSTPDWEENCRDMDKIYGSAYVTLCAASSISCHEGFLSQRGMRIRLPFQSYHRPNIRGSYGVQFKHARLLQTRDPPDVLGADLNFCRWAYRAWTFQEKALSTRQVLFGNANVHFLCEKTHESMGDDNPGEPTDNNNYQITQAVTSATPTQLHQSWDALLSLYSAFNETALTHASDILPALAGLARLFQQRLNDTYICGHWQTTLFHDLMWTLHNKLYALSREDHLAKLPARTSRLLPSWSRLLQSRRTVNLFTPSGSSNNNSFHALRPEYTHLLPDVALPAGSANPLGAVRHARLRLTTVLLEPGGMLMHGEPDPGEGEELRVQVAL